MGIVVGRPGEAEPDDLLRDAEIALYRAGGRRPRRDLRAVDSAAMMGAARPERPSRAIDWDEPSSHQPPSTSRPAIAGLGPLRWQHPVRGLVPPLRSSLAEETGLIPPDTRALGPRDGLPPGARAQLASVGHATRSASTPPRQFLQPDLVDGRRDPRRDRNPAVELELEITESVVMEDAEAGIRVLRRCAARLPPRPRRRGPGYSSVVTPEVAAADTLRSIARSWPGSPTTGPTCRQPGGHRPRPRARHHA
jgi:hypothetical protein